MTWTKDIEIVGCAVVGYECDVFKEIPQHPGSYHSQNIEPSGMMPGYVSEKLADEIYLGRQCQEYPQLYRIKIHVEAEPLSDEECEARWKAHAEANR